MLEFRVETDFMQSIKAIIDASKAQYLKVSGKTRKYSEMNKIEYSSSAFLTIEVDHDKRRKKKSAGVHLYHLETTNVYRSWVTKGGPDDSNRNEDCIDLWSSSLTNNRLNNENMPTGHSNGTKLEPNRTGDVPSGGKWTLN